MGNHPHDGILLPVDMRERCIGRMEFGGAFTNTLFEHFIGALELRHQSAIFDDEIVLYERFTYDRVQFFRQRGCGGRRLCLAARRGYAARELEDDLRSLCTLGDHDVVGASDRIDGVCLCMAARL